jgi:hypothetical protein
LYANGFRYYFTPLPGYFSPFPHGTCPLSVFWEYLGLSGGPDRFTRDFSGPVILGILLAPLDHFDYGVGTLYDRPCNACRLSHMIGLASSDFARHYSRNHCCFLFLWVLRCFTSPRSLYPPYIFRRESPGHIATPGGVSPFGNPRIKVRLSTPRGLSQISTSFFGSRSQGIHRLHLET